MHVFMYVRWPVYMFIIVCYISAQSFFFSSLSPPLSLEFSQGRGDGGTKATVTL